MLAALIIAAGLTWSQADTARELAFVGVYAVDMGQTAGIGEDCHESNHVLGLCADRTRILEYSAAFLPLHAAVSRAMPRPYREAWQYVWIGFEVEAVEHNFSLGFAVRW